MASRFQFILEHPTLGTETLSKDPFGWNELELTLRRSEQYEGIFYTIGTALQFYCGGAGKDFVDNAYDLDGIDGQVSITINYRCKGTEDIYTELFTGRLNFSTYEKDLISFGTKVSSVEIEQESIVTNFLARQNVEVPLNANNCIDQSTAMPSTPNFGSYALNMHSKKIKLISDWQSNGTTNNSQSGTMIVGAARSLFITPQLDIKTANLKESTSNPFFVEGFQPSIVLKETLFPSIHSTKNVNTIPLQADIYEASYLIEYDIQGTLTIDTDSASSFFFNDINLTIAYGSNKDDVEVYQDLIQTGGSASTIRVIPFSVSGSFNTNLPSGYEWFDKNFELWCYITIPNLTYTSGPGSGTVTTTISLELTTAELTITCDSEKPATTANSYAINEACARAAAYVTNQTDAFNSSLLGLKTSQPNSYANNGDFGFLALTNGFNIRGYSETDRPIKVKWSELYQALNAVLNIGLGIETINGVEKIVIEQKDYFYDNTTVITLDNPNDVELKIVSEEHYNAILVGYEKWDIKDVQGLDEPNSTRDYANNLQSVENIYDITSPYVAAMYAIESTRRTTSTDFEDVDTDYDNLNFLIALNRSVDGSGNPSNLTTAEQDENYNNISGLTLPEESYNLRLTPVANFLRHISKIAVGLSKLVGFDLLFQGGTGNYELSKEDTLTTLPGSYSGTALDENGNFAWDDSDIINNTPLHLPELISFEHPLSYTQWQSLQANTKGLIELVNGTITYYGYIKELTYNPYTGKANFILIRRYTS